MAIQSNPPARVGETDIITARKEAAAKLLPLFGGKTADGEEVTGVFHTHGIAAVVGASADNKKFVDELRKDKSARDLATFASTHGHPKFPPALVAEFLSRPEVEESNDWFAEVYLGGLREIFLATCSPGKTDGVGLVLSPARPGIDLLKAALNVFDHLTPEEAKKLGLSKPNEAVRQEFPSDFLEMAEFQLEPATLTAAQRLDRGSVKKWEEREKHQAEKDTNKAIVASATDPAMALPQAMPPVVVVPKPEPEPETPKTPSLAVVPGLSALAGGGSATAASRASRSKKAVAAVPATLVVAPLPAPPPVPPVEAPSPAAPLAAEDEDRELMLAAIKKAADSDNYPAKAFLSLMKPETSLEEITTFVQKRKIF